METNNLVIAADGPWSSTRSSFLRRALLPKPTGDIAYRVVLRANQVKEDMEIQDNISCPGIRI